MSHKYTVKVPVVSNDQRMWTQPHNRWSLGWLRAGSLRTPGPFLESRREPYQIRFLPTEALGVTTSQNLPAHAML